MSCHQTIPPTMHHLLTPGSMLPYFWMKKRYNATKFKTIFKFQWFQHLRRWFFQHSGFFILWDHCLHLTCTPLILATQSSKYGPWPNACTCSNIPISITPPSDNHLYPFSLLLLRPNFIYPLILQCMDSSTFFLSPTPKTSSLLFLSNVDAWFNHYHHSFNSSLELLYILSWPNHDFHFD